MPKKTELVPKYLKLGLVVLFILKRSKLHKDVQNFGPQYSKAIYNKSSYLYHFRSGAETKQLDTLSKDMETFVNEAKNMSIIDWLKEPQVYVVAGIYMTTRLFVNLTQGIMIGISWL